jgi:hypothetical protein
MMAAIGRSRVAGFVGLVAGALLVTGLIADPAGAHTKPPPKSAFAGYQLSSAPVTSTTATFTLPSFRCTKKNAAVTVQLDAYDSLQSAFNYEYLTLGCSKKRVASYSASVIVVGTSTTSGTVALDAGDTVVFSISCGATGSTTSIDDVTTASTESASSSTPSTCSEVFVGDYGQPKSPTKVENLPAFGKVQWTNVMVNGSALGSFSPMATNYYEGKKNVIDAGPLSGGGTAFTNTEG